MYVSLAVEVHQSPSHVMRTRGWGCDLKKRWMDMSEAMGAHGTTVCLTTRGVCLSQTGRARACSCAIFGRPSSPFSRPLRAWASAPQAARRGGTGHFHMLAGDARTDQALC